MRGHWSDCAVHNSPALQSGACDCGGLELAPDSAHDLIPALVSGARSERFLVCNESSGRFVQSQQLPADRLMAHAAASHLPNTHDGMVLLGDANGVDLDVAGITIISKLKNVP